MSFTGKKNPADLTFHNKNHLPVPETEIYAAAAQMRRRINTDASFMHVQKTIDRAVKNQGFFQPIYTLRSQQSEYLVLVDAGHNNNQQVKLFDYLIEVLKKQNVFIEKYYYRYEPMLCYNSAETKGISLEKLSERYDKHILLIFGNAYQLLYEFYPVFNTEYLQLLERWQKKAVLTPVSFPDWTNKEKAALLQHIPVIPVDVEGLLILMEILFAKEYDLTTILHHHLNSFYAVTPLNFESIDELQVYCDEAIWAIAYEDGKAINILFQWIAALSVYPKIKWELTLAIGKAILSEYGKPEKLNFTNLLRIARIKWMKDGQFPDYTRLDLLKKLSAKNKIIARETILQLLKEIPESELNEKHFAYEEKEIQRISNEFILYAYNPVKYSGYIESKELYKKFWEEKRITDAPSRLYLKNEGVKWNTLISKSKNTKEIWNVSTEDYFEPELETAKAGNRLNLLYIRVSIVLLCISLLSIFIIALYRWWPFQGFVKPIILRVEPAYVFEQNQPITIYVKNFPVNTDSVQVIFNGVIATIQSKSADSLVAFYPQEADQSLWRGSVKVGIIIHNDTLYSNKDLFVLKHLSNPDSNLSIPEYQEPTLPNGYEPSNMTEKERKIEIQKLNESLKKIKEERDKKYMIKEHR